MSILKARLTTAEDVAAWLNTNATAFFSSVTCEGAGSTATVKMYDKDNNEVFRSFTSYCQAYRASGNYIRSQALGSTYDRFKNSDIIMCDNGFILVSTPSGSNKFAMLVSPTIKGKLGIIFANSQDASPTPFTTSVQHVAFGDSATLSSTTSFTPESGLQTVMTPFITNADTGDVSYTPNAFYIPMCQSYGMGIGKFYLGYDTYISNGYWAIKDSRVT